MDFAATVKPAISMVTSGMRLVACHTQLAGVTIVIKKPN
jgi:hypothetical protein